MSDTNSVLNNMYKSLDKAKSILGEYNLKTIINYYESEMYTDNWLKDLTFSVNDEFQKLFNTLIAPFNCHLKYNINRYESDDVIYFTFSSSKYGDIGFIEIPDANTLYIRTKSMNELFKNKSLTELKNFVEFLNNIEKAIQEFGFTIKLH